MGALEYLHQLQQVANANNFMLVAIANASSYISGVL